MAPCTLFQTSTSPRSLTEPLQSSVSENVPTGSSKLVGRSLWAHRQREEASRRFLQSGVSDYVSSDLNDLITRHGFSQDTSSNVLIPESPQEARHLSNHVLYTPPAKLRRNYETLLSMIRPGPNQTARGDLPQRDRTGGPATGSSRLPGVPYKDFVDGLLADIDDRGYPLSPEREAFVDDLLSHCLDKHV